MSEVASTPDRATILTEAWSELLTPATVNTSVIIQTVVREQQLLNLQVWELTEKLREAANSTVVQQKEVEHYTARLKATKMRADAINKQLLVIKNRLIKVHERLRNRTMTLKRDNDLLREELTEEKKMAKQQQAHHQPPSHTEPSTTHSSAKKTEEPIKTEEVTSEALTEKPAAVKDDSLKMEDEREKENETTEGEEPNADVIAETYVDPTPLTAVETENDTQQKVGTEKDDLTTASASPPVEQTTVESDNIEQVGQGEVAEPPAKEAEEAGDDAENTEDQASNSNKPKPKKGKKGKR